MNDGTMGSKKRNQRTSVEVFLAFLKLGLPRLAGRSPISAISGLNLSSGGNG
jgi:hypothetical protein